MFRKISLLLVLLFPFMGTGAFATSLEGPQSQNWKPTWREPVGFITTSATIKAYVSAPEAFLDFCTRHPADCTPPASDISHVELTAERMRDLNEVNAVVNNTLFFNSDLSTRDIWDYPQDGIGDCEDFVIEKRKQLMQRGWPEDALLITIVRKRVPDFAGRTGHAVLTVRTAQGDYVLDNEILSAVPWKTAGKLFDYVMMQTQENPRLWALVDSPPQMH